MAAGSHPTHDVVIVGAGVNGALVAKRLTAAGLKVLVLEAGPGDGVFVRRLHRPSQPLLRGVGQGPRVRLAAGRAAPQPDTADVRVRRRLLRADSARTSTAAATPRLLGGSTLHWLGVCLRMLPEDFELQTRYGVGRDWPIGYADLEPYYREAEWEIGVSADVADQSHLGVEFAGGYDYPMRALPPSYSDQVLAAAVDGMKVSLGGQSFALRSATIPRRATRYPGTGTSRPARSTSAARGRPSRVTSASGAPATPRAPRSARSRPSTTRRSRWRRPTRATSPSSLRPWRRRSIVDPVSGAVQGIEYQRYEDPGSPRHEPADGDGRALTCSPRTPWRTPSSCWRPGSAATARSARGLMDHPALYAWGLSPVPRRRLPGPAVHRGNRRPARRRVPHAARRVPLRHRQRRLAGDDRGPRLRPSPPR